MENLNYMNKSSTRGIFLSIILLFSMVLVVIPLNVYAEEINVKSFAFEETTIIEFTNNSNEGVNTFRIWLGSDFSFKSFKTEKGWVGEKTPLGVIIFTSSETIKPGESVKFGIKTDKAKAGINWKALDKRDNQIGTGKVLPGELPKVIQNTEPKQDQIIENTGASISTESTFKIIPEKPNVGSSIRVTGDKFGASQEFDFYINSEKIGSFETDESGHFMTTMKIPENQEKGSRVDFKIKDKDGEEKKISLRLGNVTSGIPEPLIKLTIKGIPNIIHRGDFLEIFGTGEPYSAVTAKITNSEGDIINTRTAQVDKFGNWELEEPIIVSLDTPFGKYSATINDGGNKPILKYWTVESDKVIIITSSGLKFEQGETIKFNGTALPNKSIDVVLEDPKGARIFADVIQTDDFGFVEFEVPIARSATKGTYTLIATQEKEKEFIFVGVGQLPSIPVNLEFDKLNYKTSETAIISISGKGSNIVGLLILDPSDNQIGKDVSITLEPDGRGTYSLNLDGYSSGVYTAIISKGNAKSTETFTVGLQIGSGKIEINTTKVNYLPGDSILILGDTAPNVLLTIILYDPDGNEIRLIDTYSDKNGKISESTITIPSNGKPGVWTINANSGQNLHIEEIEVLATLVEGIQVTAEEGVPVPGFGETIVIKVVGAKQTVSIKIIAADGEMIDDSLKCNATSGQSCQVPWIIPKETEPGIYTIKVTDAVSSAETTFKVEQE